jgi:hypothetical protein
VNVAVAVMVIAATVAIFVGIVDALITMTSGKRVQRFLPTGDPEPVVGWGFTIWTMLLGAFFMGAPQWFCGPSWSYFPQLPHNSFGMGLCLTILSLLHAVARLRRSSNHVVSVLLFLKGFVFWTAGITLGAEGSARRHSPTVPRRAKNEPVHH